MILILLFSPTTQSPKKVHKCKCHLIISLSLGLRHAISRFRKYPTLSPTQIIILDLLQHVFYKDHVNSNSHETFHCMKINQVVLMNSPLHNIIYWLICFIYSENKFNISEYSFIPLYVLSNNALSKGTKYFVHYFILPWFIIDNQNHMSYASFGKRHFGSFVCKYKTHIFLAYMLSIAEDQVLKKKKFSNFSQLCR